MSTLPAPPAVIYLPGMDCTYYVVEIDDSGERRIVTGAHTPLQAAVRASRVVPEINAADFSETWNASNEGGTARYMIGVEE